MMRQIKHDVECSLPGVSETERTLVLVRLGELEASLTALLALEHDYVEDWMSGRDDGIGASVLKVRGTELLQAMTEFWRNVLGSYGACYDPENRKGGEGLSAAEPWVRATAVNYAYLYGRCWSIFGGSNEIQRNIIAASLLRS